MLPGGGTWGLNQAPIIEWVKTTSATNEISMSVCTGAFFLADAGLLEGRKATTHYSGIRALREKYPGVTVEENVRYVDSGNVVTSAGVSAGIDGALHIVDRLLGRRAAERTARYMQYQWVADAKAVEPTSDIRRGLEAWHARDHAGVVAAYKAYLESNPSDAIALHRLGIAYNQLGDHAKAITALRKAIELGNGQAAGEVAFALLALGKFEEARGELEAVAKASPTPRDLYNLACARARCGDRAGALDALDQAFAAGFFISAERLDTDDDLATIRTEPRFRAHVARIGS